MTLKPSHPMESDLAQIGRTLLRADAYAKVTGQERYAVDYYGRDFVWAGVKRAGVPHARLKGIAVEAARGLPGVLAVLTHQDVPGSNRLGLIRKDRPVLVDTRIRYGGDAVALVLAGHPLWREREGWKAAAAPFKRRGVGLVLPDTDRCLPSGPASASRCTYTYGNALIGAADAMKKRLLNRAAALLRTADRDDLSLIPGRVRHRPSGKEISLSRLARSMDPTERVCTHYYRVPVAQERPNLQSSSDPPGLPHLLFSYYAAHLACAEVDELTGEVEVRAYLAVSDCGRVINPQIYQQQVQGGIAQGLGYALSEEFVVEKGRVCTPNLATYILPTALDVPEMVSLPVEVPEPTGPFGLKGIGEISINGPLPAVANAVADACGIRIFRAPLTAERVLTALQESGRREARP